MTLAPSPSTLTAILKRAVESPWGLRIKTNRPDSLRREFYNLRHQLRRTGTTIYNRLSFRGDPRGSTDSLWIIKDGKRNSSGKGEHPASKE